VAHRVIADVIGRRLAEPADRRTAAPAHRRAGGARRARFASAALTIVAAGLALLPAARARAQDAGAILDRAVAAYGRVSTFRADFVQEVSDPMIGDAEPSRGEFLQQRPNRFAMRWRQPRGDLIVADGQYLWVFLPSSTPNQVVRSRLTGRAGESADIVAEFLDRPRDRFGVAYVRADRAGARVADVLALTPLQRSASYSRVLIWVDRQDTLVHKVEITEASGSVRRIAFDRIRINVTIPASAFTFQPPAGIRVVDASP
jgi:outer membrane lipoprotein-sorting protein